MKRFVSVLLVLSLVLSAFLVSASAADDSGTWFDVVSNCNYYVFHPGSSDAVESPLPRYVGTFSSLSVDFYTYLPLISDLTITFRSSVKPSSINFDGNNLTFSSSPRTNTYTYTASDIALNGTFPTLYVNWVSSHSEDFRILDLQFNCGSVSSLAGSIKYGSKTAAFGGSQFVSLPDSTSGGVRTYSISGNGKFSGKCDYLMLSLSFIDMRTTDDKQLVSSADGPGLIVYDSAGNSLPYTCVSYRFQGGSGLAMYKIDCSSVSSFTTFAFSFVSFTQYSIDVYSPVAYSVASAPSGNVLRDLITWIQKGFKSVVDAINGGETDTSGAGELDSAGSQIEGFENNHQSDINSGFDDVSSASSGLTAFSGPLAFIGNFVTLAFGKMGDFQMVYTLPLLIAFVLFICSRSSSVAVLPFSHDKGSWSGNYEVDRVLHKGDYS